ncbi:catalase A [Schistosoma haematobium]|uniref:Catalase A n=1 Tax=Schistosoma haematobium TaxID=6185 RepID=A0A922M0B2_SCHHA|nr:catalase A [Schistosoma haematobium]KAH9596970.1 catalase A [Schistosoma haematobium]
MKVFLLLNIITIVTIAQHLNSQYDEIWKQWKLKYNKTYSINDEMKRKIIFMKYVTKIHQHNLLYDLGLKSYTMGLNQFCDMDWNELKTILFPNGFINHHPLWNDNNEELPLLSHKSLPLKWDWRDYGLVTSVKDQVS